MHNAYGARTLLKKYCGLRSDKRMRIPEIIWQHGWLTPFHNRDPDTLVGESAQTSYLTNETYLVAREDQAKALNNFGIGDVHAIGLPFAYALAMDDRRNRRSPNSLVVMPSAHGSTPQSTSLHLDDGYIKFLLEQLSEFETIKVIMNCDDLKNGRSELWEQHGFRVELGACDGDDTSLPRLVKIFSETEVVTTNGFGSHIVYAAAAGCKVSIAGPGPENVSSVNPWGAPFYVNRPDLLDIESEILAKTESFLSSMGLFQNPVDSVDITDWAQSQIGFDHVLQPGQLKDLLNAAYSRHRPLGRRWGLHELRKKLGQVRRDIQIAGTSIGPAGTLPFFPKLRNLIQIFSPHPKDKIVPIEISDSDSNLLARHQSSDWASIHQNFVSRQYDVIDVGSPKKILVAGSYIGLSLLYFAHRFPTATLVGVEADPDNYLIGKQNCDVYPNIRTRHLALWPTDGSVSLLRSPEGWQSSKVIESVDGLSQVESWTIEKLIKEQGWRNADLIVLDVEGSEYQLLKTAAESFKKSCSKLLVRFTHRLAHQQAINDIVSTLTESNDEKCHWFADFALFCFDAQSQELGLSSLPQGDCPDK